MKKYNKTELIRRIIGSELIPLGFSPLFDTHLGIWGYRRKKGEGTQLLEITSKPMTGVIELYFCATANVPAYQYKASSFLRKHHMDLKQYYCNDSYPAWHYDSKEEFVKILNVYRQLISDYILGELERLNIPTSEVRISVANFNYLRENMDKIFRESMEKWKLDSLPFDDQIRQLSEMIQSQKTKPFKEAEQILSEIGVTFGFLLIEKYDGKWHFDEVYNIITALLLKQVQNIVYPVIHPILCAFKEWRGEKDIIYAAEEIKREVQQKRKEEQFNLQQMERYKELYLEWRRERRKAKRQQKNIK